jgi:hypothetical protein
VPNLTVKDLVEKLPHGQPATATKRDDDAQPVHTHPKGFTFEYPVGWTLEDDTTNKTTLLLPPGVTLNSPGPKAMFLVDATPLQSDPFAMRAYFERQLAPARSVNYAQGPLKSDVGPGAVLSWEMEIPGTDTRSGFRSFVVIMRKNWAVHIDAFGPAATTAVHDDSADCRKLG